MDKIKRILFFITVIFVAACNNCSNINNYSPWKFAVFCDTRGFNKPGGSGKECLNIDIIEKIAQDIVAEGCELVIVPGDLVNGGFTMNNNEVVCSLSYDNQFKKWKDAMSAVYEKEIPVFTIRGNHESGSRPRDNPGLLCDIIPNEELKATYLNAFGTANPQKGPDGEVGLTYYFTHKNAFFVGFDAYVRPNRVNLSWFKQILKKERDSKKTPHLFTYSHCPAYVVVHEDSLACYPQQRDEFWNLLAENGGKLYFCGHDHMYNRASVTAANGIEVFQALVGSCGAPFKTWHPPYKNQRVKGYFHNDTNYGYMIVTVEENNLNVEWRALSDGGALPWESKDNFTCAVNTL